MTTGKTVAARMLEADLLGAVIDLAHLHGWLVAHFRPAQTVRGWRTPVEADGAGFPDLVLAHAGARRLVFAELKRQDGKTDQRQERWLTTLEAVADLSSANGMHRPLFPAPVMAVVWRPSDYLDGIIERVLRVSPAERAAASATP